MASAAPLTWSWPLIDASRPSLSSSSLSLSAIFFHDPIRPFTVARRIPRSSPRDPPPSVEHNKIDIDLNELLSLEVIEKGGRQNTGSPPVAEGTDIFSPLNRRQRARLRLESVRRLPLWKRIVFASKKVRSIILLNVITVIYGYSLQVQVASSQVQGYRSQVSEYLYTTVLGSFSLRRGVLSKTLNCLDFRLVFQLTFSAASTSSSDSFLEH